MSTTAAPLSNRDRAVLRVVAAGRCRISPIGDELVDKIAERARALRVGPGTDPASEMGPLITREHRDKVASYVPKAREQGAEVLSFGENRGLRAAIAAGYGYAAEHGYE